MMVLKKMENDDGTWWTSKKVMTVPPFEKWAPCFVLEDEDEDDDEDDDEDEDEDEDDDDDDVFCGTSPDI